MTGTIINVIAILIGGALGLLFGARLPERLGSTVVAGLGLFTVAIGMQMFLKTENPLIVLGAILIGVLLGEWWKIEDGLHNLGRFLEARFMSEPGLATDGQPHPKKDFMRGFLTTSLLVCVGPIAILGSIQDGLTGNYQLLVVKAIMDGFASLAFASTMGVGVLFSSLPLLMYQGAISLLATQLNVFVTQAMMNEMTAAGGVILIGVAISSILELKKIRVGNFLPALAVAPLIVWILSLLGG